MKERKVKLEGLPEMTETEAARYVLNKLRGKDLFAERTAFARKILGKFNTGQQA